jgi:protein-S-isoprenylcysteine O-methyltransferase Ste14
MLWFYESFFPVVWIVFFLYWQIKAANTKTTLRLEPAASRILRAFMMLIAIILLSTTRIPLPWLYLQLWRVGIWPFWLGAVVTIAGLLFAIWAREHLGSNWSRSVTIKQGHELITSGPYAVVRHPIYTGILTGFLSMAIAISQVRGSSFSFSSSSRSGSRSAWRNSGCVLSSARHMPPMLIRPLPWCLTSSDRCVTISANNSELNQFEELHREIDSRFRSSNGQSLLYR